MKLLQTRAAWLWFDFNRLLNNGKYSARPRLVQAKDGIPAVKPA